jgi:AsmA protein
MPDRPSPKTDSRGIPPAGEVRAVRPRTSAAQQRRGSGRPAPTRAGRSWLAFAGYAGLGLLCLVLAGLTFLLVATPTDLIRDRIAERVKLRTGRDLLVTGPTSLSLFPRPALSLREVALSAPGNEGPPTLSMQGLDVELGLWPLLVSQQVSVKRLRVTRPAIELRVDAEGRRSWDFAVERAAVRPAAAVTDAEAAAQAAPPGRGPRPRLPLEALAPVNVSILDGTVHYQDERSGTRHTVSALDLDLALNDAAGPLEAKGNLTWRDEKLAFDAILSSVRALLAESETRVSLKVGGQPLQATYQGSLSLAGGLALDGQAGISAPSLQALEAWLGKRLAGGREAGAVAISTPVALANGQLSLSDLNARIGDSLINGALTANTKAARVHVKGSLKLAELDLGSLFPRGGVPAAAPVPGAAGERASPSPELRGSQVKGFTRRADGSGSWSDDIIDFARLGLADADLTLAVASLKFRDVKTGPSQVTLALQDKVANLALIEMQLYGGRGRGVVSLDGAGQVPAVGLKLALDEVSIQPLLKDAMGVEWLAGRGKIALTLATQGVSERQLIESLNGNLEMEAANGALHGLDLSRVLRDIERGQLDAFQVTPGEKTQFSEFAGSFAIANGTAQNQNLRINSPHIRMTGAGSINLAQRQIDYTVRPKVVESAAGQSAAVKLAGLEVPVRIHGPWEKVAYKPDLKGVLKSEQAGEALRQIGKNLKSPEVQEAVKGLLGGGDGQQKVKPRELLEKLLKKE